MTASVRLEVCMGDGKGLAGRVSCTLWGQLEKADGGSWSRRATLQKDFGSIFCPPAHKRSPQWCLGWQEAVEA